MNINVSIMISPGDDIGDPAELAAAVLEAVGGDVTKDICTVNIVGSGTAGTVAPPPMPPPVQTPP